MFYEGQKETSKFQTFQFLVYKLKKKERKEKEKRIGRFYKN